VTIIIIIIIGDHDDALNGGRNAQKKSDYHHKAVKSREEWLVCDNQLSPCVGIKGHRGRWLGVRETGAQKTQHSREGQASTTGNCQRIRSEKENRNEGKSTETQLDQAGQEEAQSTSSNKGRRHGGCCCSLFNRVVRGSPTGYCHRRRHCTRGHCCKRWRLNNICSMSLFRSSINQWRNFKLYGLKLSDSDRNFPKMSSQDPVYDDIMTNPKQTYEDLAIFEAKYFRPLFPNIPKILTMRSAPIR
jgi:hypothetical protein